MDWYYDTLPPETPEVSRGDGWCLITLPCKEMENLFCDPEVLFEAYERRLATEVLQSIIDEESHAPELVDEWRYQVVHRIRNRLPPSDDPSTRERAPMRRSSLGLETLRLDVGLWRGRGCSDRSGTAFGVSTR